jgi:uncharacterized protein (TIGR00730 family)
MATVCVFCGASIGAKPAYAAAACAMVEALAARGCGLVYGGGSVGLMGVLADAALAKGVPVTGVIPRFLTKLEAAHPKVADMRLVDSMHERKALMAELADAFVALPGAFGTLDELCEMLTWNQLGIQRKPCGLLNVAGYYDALLAMLDHAVADEFLTPRNRQLVTSDDQPARLLAHLLEGIALTAPASSEE